MLPDPLDIDGALLGICTNSLLVPPFDPLMVRLSSVVTPPFSLDGSHLAGYPLGPPRGASTAGVIVINAYGALPDEDEDEDVGGGASVA